MTKGRRRGMTRDEMLALLREHPHWTSEQKLDAVLAAGERRWLCGRDDPGCGPELVAQYPGVHNERVGCCEWVVLPDWTKP